MGAVRQYCDRAIMIEKGVIAKEGTPEQIAAAYQQLFIDEIESQSTKDNIEGERWGSGEIRTTNTKIDVKKDHIVITTEYTANDLIESPVFGISVFSPAGLGLIDANTYQVKKKTGSVRKGEVIRLVWELPNIFINGKYRVSVGCASSTFNKIYDQVTDAGSFRITRETPTGGIIFPDVQLKELTIDPAVGKRKTTTK
jgi:hypothetical protein